MCRSLATRAWTAARKEGLDGTWGTRCTLALAGAFGRCGSFRPFPPPSLTRWHCGRSVWSLWEPAPAGHQTAADRADRADQTSADQTGPIRPGRADQTAADRVAESDPPSQVI